MKISRHPISLDRPVGESEDSYFGDFIEDEKAESPVSTASGEMLRDRIEAVLKTLTYREREIIKLRYGIGDGYTYTLEEVGKIFKVTRERVRQVEAKAIRKLQHPVRAASSRASSACAGKRQDSALTAAATVRSGRWVAWQGNRFWVRKPNWPTRNQLTTSQVAMPSPHRPLPSWGRAQATSCFSA
jgi:DNA-binding CsgD family transcriptional regulator